MTARHAHKACNLIFSCHKYAQSSLVKKKRKRVSRRSLQSFIISASFFIQFCLSYNAGLVIIGQKNKNFSKKRAVKITDVVCLIGLSLSLIWRCRSDFFIWFISGTNRPRAEKTHLRTRTALQVSLRSASSETEAKSWTKQQSKISSTQWRRTGRKFGGRNRRQKVKK